MHLVCHSDDMCDVTRLRRIVLGIVVGDSLRCTNESFEFLSYGTQNVGFLIIKALGHWQPLVGKNTFLHYIPGQFHDMYISGKSL